MESMGLLTGWRNDVFQIFGTSRMLCGSVPQVNENIWEMHHEWGDCENGCFEVF